MITTEKILTMMQGNYPLEVSSLETFLEYVSLLMPLLHALPNANFFVKDNQARYMLVNENLAKRCQLNLNQLLGQRSQDIFPADLGKGYTEQDYKVMRQQRQMLNQLELHSYQSGVLGWCFTTKIPIFNQAQQVVGLVGISLDLQDEKLISAALNEKLAKVVDYISQHFSRTIKVQELAQLAQLSVSQLDRQFKSVLQMTPLQYIQKKRLEHAIELLHKDTSITDIAARCGYTDHSAFSRKFKELTTLTPTQFRQRHQP